MEHVLHIHLLDILNTSAIDFYFSQLESQHSLFQGKQENTKLQYISSYWILPQLKGMLLIILTAGGFIQNKKTSLSKQ